MPTSRRVFLRNASALAAGVLWEPRINRALAETAHAAVPALPIRMSSGASSAGLNFVLRNSAAGRKYQVETLPGGLGVIDFEATAGPISSAPMARLFRR